MSQYHAKKNNRLYAKKATEYLLDILNAKETKVLIMNGDLDYYINYVGTEKILNNLKFGSWSELFGKDKYDPEEYFYEAKNRQGSPRVKGGRKMASEQLSYIRVENAGLRIAHEKPELMFNTLKKWIENKKNINE